MSYNGYTNWETWNVMLWASNEEDIYNEVCRFLEFYPKPTPGMCQGFFEDIFPCGTPDMERASEMCPVNWNSIANHLREWND